MGYTSLNNLARSYELVSSGVSKLYAILFEDLIKIDGDKVYTILDGQINAIGIDNIKFIQVGLLKNSTHFEETLKRDIAKGIKYVEQKIVTVLSDLSIANRTWVENAVGRPVAIIIKDLSGNYYFIGQDGYLEITETSGGIGSNEIDLKGYTITFTCPSKKYVYRVDPSIMDEMVNGGANPAPKFTAYWGWVSDPSQINSVEAITSLQGSGEFTTGAAVLADYRSNTEPMYLVMAELLTEPAKIDWYGSTLNQGQIGNPDTDLFNAPITVDTYGVYISVYPTTQTDTKIKFLS